MNYINPKQFRLTHENSARLKKAVKMLSRDKSQAGIVSENSVINHALEQYFDELGIKEEGPA